MSVNVFCLWWQIRSNFNHVNGFAVNSQATFVVIRHCSSVGGFHLVTFQGWIDPSQSLSNSLICELKNCTAFHPIKTALACSTSENNGHFPSFKDKKDSNRQNSISLFDCKMLADFLKIRFKFQNSEHRPPLEYVSSEWTHQCEIPSFMFY